MAEPYSRLAGVYDEIVVDPCHERWAAYLDDSGAPTRTVRTRSWTCAADRPDVRRSCRLGYRVTGVDGSWPMLARARHRLGPDTVLLQQTLPDLMVDGVFDAAVSTFDGLNYLTPAEFGRTFRQWAAGSGRAAGSCSTCIPMRCWRLRSHPVVAGKPAESASRSATPWTSGAHLRHSDRYQGNRRPTRSVSNIASSSSPPRRFAAPSPMPASDRRRH